MAATSILEPLCELYRMTGARAFLSFADEITQSWEHDNGAHILSALGSRGIDGLPNGKAAGERCPHLTAEFLCAIFGRPERPSVCSGFAAAEYVCGSSREEAIRLIGWL